MEINDELLVEQTNVSPKEGDYFCPHYHRKCKFVTPCCDGVYRCRFCHDEEQNHTLKREDVTVVECCQCGERQDVVEFCRKCNLQFGKYFCYECKLYDDEDKQQFHCQGCGICRVGGRKNYFHCHRCDMCLPNHLQGAHKCVEKVSRSNCPVCQEDIHTSRIPSQIPPCNHLIHKNCFDEMLSNGHYACPVCGISMINMEEIWKIYDKDIAETPMPEDYDNLCARIQCRDCSTASISPFHIVGIKCGECGSYNTVRDKGPLIRKQDGVLVHDITRTEGRDHLDESSVSEDLLRLEMDEDNGGTGSLTPPETPNREHAVYGEGHILATGSQSVPVTPQNQLTPEPSPVRELLQLRPSAINPSVLRRISFSDDPVEDQINGGDDSAGGTLDDSSLVASTEPSPHQTIDE